MKLHGNRNLVAGLAAVALAVLCFDPALRAQDQAQVPGQGSGQPARAVRLSYVDGQVTLSQGGQVLAQQAVANAPLLEGMQLTTADSGKAEIQFEDGSVARISPDSSLTLRVLQGAGTTGNAVLVLNSGLAYFEFQGGGQAGQMSVQFGDAQVTTSGFTVFRVGMDNLPGQVAVFSGNAHLESAGGNVTADLHGGESIALNAASPANYQLAESIEPDSWDEWNSDRDQAMTAEAASQTGATANLSEPQNPAWNDLDADGNWYDVPGQGYIWSPYEAASAAFDPYGYGNWMWTPGYGYLWVSGYPWGFMPFQCGAWNYFEGFGWGWAPGPGGCSPWWGLGLYGGPNFGNLPPGYRPIPRPILPRRPIGGRPVPLVAVNRSPVIGGRALPARNRNTPVTIGGSTVVALRPMPSRPVVEHAPSMGGGHEQQPGNEAPQPQSRPGNTNRPGYNFNRPTPEEPAEGNRPEPSRPAFQGQPQPSHDAAPSRPSFSSGESGNHPSGGSSGGGSPHPSGGSSSGGGGGGASHSGGGGGGGGSHSSGVGGGGGGGGSHGGGGGGGAGGSHK
ncbi:MAG: DUF6600 domain-containing protein [Bryobacteraceae bacterium]|jgi:uncharacterized membrane protein YgcG